jgi:hypothetical protein
MARHEIKTGRKKTALCSLFISAFQVAMYFFSGPLTARMVEQAGTRPVCIAGAAISGTRATA